MDRIHVFTTGGTIDKVYFDAKSEYQVGPPAIAKYLEAIQVTFPFEITSLLHKDSLEMTAEDRELISSSVASAAERRILITHGTDTMVDTAKHLLEIPDKTIVLTGSLLPGGFHDTDAVFNVGFALGALQALDPGVYVCMNGRVFDPRRVRKYRDKGIFAEEAGE